MFGIISGVNPNEAHFEDMYNEKLHFSENQVGVLVRTIQSRLGIKVGTWIVIMVGESQIKNEVIMVKV